MRTRSLNPFPVIRPLAAAALLGALAITAGHSQADAAARKAASGAAIGPVAAEVAGTPVATLVASRFDGQWKWRKVYLDGPCGSLSIKTFEVRDGSIEGSGRHPVAGSIHLQ